MALIEVPQDFYPEFSRDYTLGGKTFTLEVQYRGIFLDDKIQKTHHYWATKLIIDNELIVAGPFRHATDGREMTREGVANNLATFYSYNLDGLIKRSRKERREAAAIELTLDEIVNKCVTYMFTELVTAQQIAESEAYMDYDILRSVKIEQGWTVILDPAADPHYIYIFDFKTGTDKVTIETYVKAHSFKIPRF